MIKKHFSIFLLLLILITFASIVGAILVGSVNISPSIIWDVLCWKLGFTNSLTEASIAQSTIIWEIRLPRILLAIAVGAGLSISGAAIQALVQNSIADPYILGVSSGASVGATAVIILGAFSFLGNWALSLAAFIGALIAVFIVFLLARVGGRTSIIRLLLAGIAISLIFSAITNFILIMTKDAGGMKAVMHWMLGSLAGAKWSNIQIPILVCIAVFLFLYCFTNSLNALLLGEETATTLGISLEKFRLIIIVSVSLLTGVLVAVSGTIGFVGLIIPHIVRMLVGSHYRYVLPSSALIGAIFLIWADTLSRIIIAPEEMPIGILTALCGGPFFIWLLRKEGYTFGTND